MIKAVRKSQLEQEKKHEHEFEAAPGLPEPLPADEKLLWQGAPDWQQLALHAFHVGKVALYFALLLGLDLTWLINEHASIETILFSVLKITSVGLLTLTLLAGLAWLSSRTTLYSMTDKRLVMRIGMVLTVTFNLPYKRIESASIKRYRHGNGDIALQIKAGDHIAWFHLWPHARAWRLAHPEPALRCLPEVAEVAQLLLRAWSSQQDQPTAVSSAAIPGETPASTPGAKAATAATHTASVPA